MSPAVPQNVCVCVNGVYGINAVQLCHARLVSGPVLGAPPLVSAVLLRRAPVQGPGLLGWLASYPCVPVIKSTHCMCIVVLGRPYRLAVRVRPQC